ncbi:hypothetical protein MTBLM5_50138 [Magnetospirillum sp. LM-5]|nr:hypothetical protein MTBLM5_50138 [Magnetospirillum sp. LM-5]
MGGLGHRQRDRRSGRGAGKNFSDFSKASYQSGLSGNRHRIGHRQENRRTPWRTHLGRGRTGGRVGLPLHRAGGESGCCINATGSALKLQTQLTENFVCSFCLRMKARLTNLLFLLG